MPIERTEEDHGFYILERFTATGPDMAEAFRQFAERHNKAISEWRGYLEKLYDEAEAFLQQQEALPAHRRAPVREREKAARVVIQTHAIGHQITTGNAELAALEGFLLGKLLHRIRHEPFEPLVKAACQVHFYAGGKWVRVTPLERRILDYFLGKSEANIYDFHHRVWGRHYTDSERSKIKKALSALSAKLAEQGVPFDASIDRRAPERITIS